MLKNIAICILIIGCVCLTAEDQIPFSKKPLDLNTGLLNSTRSANTASFREIISIPDAKWLRLHFDNCELGKKSYIKITSLKDHGIQILDAKDLKLWNSSSAYFNGNRVLLELFVAPSDVDVFFNCSEISVGELGATSRSICGSTDDRTASDDKRSGRLVPVGCTGWLIGNGYLTAGHCVDGHAVEVLEFHVPASDADGSINHPAPKHQYPVLGTVKFKNGGQGGDWGVFKVGKNSVTGLTPLQAQKSYFKVSDSITPETIRITGFGVDNMPRGNGGSRNAQSQTQQTHAGPFARLSGTTLRYETDTTGGNSGSPVISDTHNVAVGIHTHGGCSSFGGDNAGTSFTNSELNDTINLLTKNTVFVDNTHPSTLKSGNIFNPYHSITNAINNAVENGSVHISPGIYAENIIATKSVKIHVITDIVTIGEKMESATAQTINQVISGNKEFNNDVIILGKNFQIAPGTNVVINAKSVTISSDINIPVGATLSINIQ